MARRVLTWAAAGRWSRWIWTGLWALAMIGLPLTSFPPITRLTGATVAPFSALPVGLLLVSWFLVYITKRGKLPRETVPFIVFSLLSIALTALAFFRVDEYFRNEPLLGQVVETYVPLGVGLAFFLITSAWHKDAGGLRRTLQFIYAGGALLLVWSILQAVINYRFNYNYPPLMVAIREALVTQSNLNGNPRLAGLTWEASWFAHQLNMLYLPLWLAATYQRTTVFPRIWKVSLENIFMVLGLGVFFLSSPRIGGLACMLMLLFLVLKFHVAIYNWLLRQLAQKRPRIAGALALKIGLGMVLAALFISLYGGFGTTVFKIVSARDWRVGLLVSSPLTATEWQEIRALDENTLFLLGLRFAFVERTVYWMDGWRIFNDFPILGVGLGNVGYYFTSHLPAVGWSSYEVRAILYQNESLPNAKSMWYRLMAETGLVGFTFFITWLLVLWSSAQHSLRSPDPTLRTVALAGQLALLAFVFEGFSVDTFGLPYLFIMAGLVASTGMIIRSRTVS